MEKAKEIDVNQQKVDENYDANRTPAISKRDKHRIKNKLDLISIEKEKRKQKALKKAKEAKEKAERNCQASRKSDVEMDQNKAGTSQFSEQNAGSRDKSSDDSSMLQLVDGEMKVLVTEMNTIQASADQKEKLLKKKQEQARRKNERRQLIALKKAEKEKEKAQAKDRSKSLTKESKKLAKKLRMEESKSLKVLLSAEKLKKHKTSSLVNNQARPKDNEVKVGTLSQDYDTTLNDVLSDFTDFLEEIPTENDDLVEMEMKRNSLLSLIGNTSMNSNLDGNITNLTTKKSSRILKFLIGDPSAGFEKYLSDQKEKHLKKKQEQSRKNKEKRQMKVLKKAENAKTKSGEKDNSIGEAKGSKLLAKKLPTMKQLKATDSNQIVKNDTEPTAIEILDPAHDEFEELLNPTKPSNQSRKTKFLFQAKENLLLSPGQQVGKRIEDNLSVQEIEAPKEMQKQKNRIDTSKVVNDLLDDVENFPQCSKGTGSLINGIVNHKGKSAGEHDEFKASDEDKKIHEKEFIKIKDLSERDAKRLKKRTEQTSRRSRKQRSKALNKAGCTNEITGKLSDSNFDDSEQIKSRFGIKHDESEDPLHYSKDNTIIFELQANKTIDSIANPVILVESSEHFANQQKGKKINDKGEKQVHCNGVLRRLDSLNSEKIDQAYNTYRGYINKDILLKNDSRTSTKKQNTNDTTPGNEFCESSEESNSIAEGNSNTGMVSSAVVGTIQVSSLSKKVSNYNKLTTKNNEINTTTVLSTVDKLHNRKASKNENQTLLNNNPPCECREASEFCEISNVSAPVTKDFFGEKEILIIENSNELLRKSLSETKLIDEKQGSYMSLSDLNAKRIKETSAKISKKNDKRQKKVIKKVEAAKPKSKAEMNLKSEQNKHTEMLSKNFKNKDCKGVEKFESPYCLKVHRQYEEMQKTSNLQRTENDSLLLPKVRDKNKDQRTNPLKKPETTKSNSEIISKSETTDVDLETELKSAIPDENKNDEVTSSVTKDNVRDTGKLSKITHCSQIERNPIIGAVKKSRNMIKSLKLSNLQIPTVEYKVNRKKNDNYGASQKSKFLKEEFSAKSRNALMKTLSSVKLKNYSSLNGDLRAVKSTNKHDINDINPELEIHLSESANKETTRTKVKGQQTNSIEMSERQLLVVPAKLDLDAVTKYHSDFKKEINKKLQETKLKEKLFKEEHKIEKQKWKVEQIEHGLLMKREKNDLKFKLKKIKHSKKCQLLKYGLQQNVNSLDTKNQVFKIQQKVNKTKDERKFLNRKSKLEAKEKAKIEKKKAKLAKEKKKNILTLLENAWDLTTNMKTYEDSQMFHIIMRSENLKEFAKKLFKICPHWSVEQKPINVQENVEQANEIMRLNIFIQRFENRIKILEKQLENQTKTSSPRAGYIKVQETNSDFQEEISELGMEQDQLQGIRDENRRLKVQIETLNSQLSAAISPVEYENLKRRNKILNEKVVQRKEERDEIHKRKNACAEELSNLRIELSRKEAQLEKYESRLETSKSEGNAWRDQYKELQRKYDDNITSAQNQMQGELSRVRQELLPNGSLDTQIVYNLKQKIIDLQLENNQKHKDILLLESNKMKTNHMEEIVQNLILLQKNIIDQYQQQVKNDEKIFRKQQQVLDSTLRRNERELFYKSEAVCMISEECQTDTTCERSSRTQTYSDTTTVTSEEQQYTAKKNRMLPNINDLTITAASTQTTFESPKPAKVQYTENYVQTVSLKPVDNCSQTYVVKSCAGTQTLNPELVEGCSQTQNTTKIAETQTQCDDTTIDQCCQTESYYSSNTISNSPPIQSDECNTGTHDVATRKSKPKPDVPIWMQELQKQSSTFTTTQNQLDDLEIPVQSDEYKTGTHDVATRKPKPKPDVPTWMQELQKQSSTFTTTQNQLDDLEIPVQSDEYKTGTHDVATRKPKPKPDVPIWMQELQKQSSTFTTTKNQLDDLEAPKLRLPRRKRRNDPPEIQALHDTKEYEKTETSGKFKILEEGRSESRFRSYEGIKDAKTVAKRDDNFSDSLADFEYYENRTRKTAMDAHERI